MHVADLLTDRISRTSPVCVGLDPQLAKLPDGISKDADGVLAFGKGIIDAVKQTAAAVKPQLAFYEVLGWQGMKVFWELCAYAKEQGLFVIADGKRGDIGSTSEAYAEAYLGASSPIDMITVHVYHGSETMTPFIDRAVKNGKGVIVLVKTSNPSAGDLQDLPIGDEVVHEHVAQLVESWGAQHIGPKSNFSCVGAVVGAPYPEEMKYLRTLMPHIPFLVPGYGAQGGTADDVRHAFLPDGTGAIVSASRSIIFASQGKDWQSAAGVAAEKMKQDLSESIKRP
jgi:orotidine-5'-phosphate decarboxylase